MATHPTLASHTSAIVTPIVATTPSYREPMSDDAHFYRCLHYRYTLFEDWNRSSRSAHPSPVDLCQDSLEMTSFLTH